ncbi:hypothetical protein [Amycolatopsis japonica]
MTDTSPLVPPTLKDLSVREEELIEAARSGSQLVCSHLEAHLLLASAMPEHRIRAGLIRELLIGKHGQLDPHGVRIRGARIIGHLDLDNLDTNLGLELTSCAMTETITARDARLAGLALTASHFGELDAMGLRLTRSLDLHNARLIGRNAAIKLYRAHVGGSLDCDDLRADHSTRPAVAADFLRVGGNLLLRNARFTSSSASGAIRLSGAHIDGQLNASDLKINNSSGPAVEAEALKVSDSVFFVNARLAGDSTQGAVNLNATQIDGQLNASGMNVNNSSGPAIEFAAGKVAASVFFVNARLTGNSTQGAVNLNATQIDSQLNASGMNVNNSSGPAFEAEVLKVGASLLLAKSRLAGIGATAAINMISANIGGQVNAECMHVDNSLGPAVQAEHLQVGNSLRLVNVRINGASADEATVRLLGAHIGSQLDAQGARIVNSVGTALDAEGLRVDSTMMLTNARLTSGTQGHNLVLHSAQIKGQLVLIGMTIFNGSKTGIQFEDAHVIGPVFFPARLVCPQPWGRSCPCLRRITLDGFKFNDLVNADWREWLHIIRYHTNYYSPSPYQHLAAAERAAGHDGNARRILIAQQQDLHRLAPEALGGRLTRSFHQLWGLLGGYGYRARRTAAALLLSLLAAGGLGLWAGHVETNPGYAAERTAATSSPGQQCTPVELIGLGLDRGLPLAPTGLRTRCDMDTTSVAGQAFTIAMWIIQAAIWGLATLALAGYTGLVRKVA